MFRTIDCSYSEFKKLVAKALTQGRFPINKEIKSKVNILRRQYQKTLSGLHKDFMGWFVEHHKDRMYNKDTCTFETYVTNCMLWYVREKLRKETLRKTREVYLEEQIALTPEETDCMKKGYDGVWRVEKQVIDTRTEDYIRPTRIRTPEEEYLAKELVGHIQQYLEKESSLWIEYITGKKTLIDISQEKGVSHVWIKKQWSHTKKGLLVYLNTVGYKQKDIDRYLT
jgi:hypothetical protein